MSSSSSNSSGIDSAFRAARETRILKIGENILDQAAAVFRELFPGKTAILIADSNTRPYAEEVLKGFLKAEIPTVETFVITDPSLYAEHRFVLLIEEELQKSDVIPVAVGSGTINDLVKLASHRLERPYMCVATAASMDGYTAFGASITYQGSKQTFSCPAPAGVVADMNVIRLAPRGMSASGYADLLSKVTAGADWILADALEEEPIDTEAWNIVQQGLRTALSDPVGVREGDARALLRLTEGLMLGGFAMQHHKTSRPASGAEHQFSHLWDMQHHTFQGKAPSHGFKVGIATLAITALYEHLLDQPLDQLNVEAALARWPEREVIENRIRELFPEEDLLAVAFRESEVKYVSSEALAKQLNLLRQKWPELRSKLRAQLVPLPEIKAMLEKVGAPTEPEMIGISRARLRHSFRLAYHIRRRFTVLDLVIRAGLMDSCLDALFGSNGIWPITDESQEKHSFANTPAIPEVPACA